MSSFHLAQTKADYQNAKQLFIEYAESLGFDLCFQGFDKELEELETMYSTPNGGILLLFENNIAMGCAAIRQHKSGIAELKRMYIKPELRGKGLGKTLLNKSIELAKQLGYKKIYLDTLSTMFAAKKLHADAGFTEIKPYNYNPMDTVKYYEKKV